MISNPTGTKGRLLERLRQVSLRTRRIFTLIRQHVRRIFVKYLLYSFNMFVEFSLLLLRESSSFGDRQNYEPSC